MSRGWLIPIFIIAMLNVILEVCLRLAPIWREPADVDAGMVLVSVLVALVLGIALGLLGLKATPTKMSAQAKWPTAAGWFTIAALLVLYTAFFWTPWRVLGLPQETDGRMIMLKMVMVFMFGGMLKQTAKSTGDKHG